MFTRDIVHKLMKEAEKAVCQEMKCRHTIGNNCDIYYDYYFISDHAPFAQTGILSWSGHREDQELVL